MMHNPESVIVIKPIANGVIVELPASNQLNDGLSDLMSGVLQGIKKVQQSDVDDILDKAKREAKKDELTPDQSVFAFPTMKEALAFLSLRYE